jgi:two-component system NtrC family sensor kinase
MLAVVASYMAGIVEHGRLRAEALERARRLEETVAQLRDAELRASARLAAQQAAESRLVQAAKLVAVGEMAAGVAHELNNPLTTVSGFAELILDETPSDAPYRADLEMVLHEARRARSVVRRLLDFARQGERVRARADINEIVGDVLALMTHFVHTSGVQLEVDLGKGLPWITLDGNQIKQVLLNLLHNALHAMPGGGRLQVRTESREKDGRDWIVTHVADNGTGMDSDELERIFEPFYTTRSESGGTGLGLSVTYGIVSEHGGTIQVESQRGSGSTFSVWLPV